MKRSYQAGFTIVELMVAATLGILILGGAISMFASNKRVYTEQDEMGRLQENARFAIDLMVNDIRMAGHTGCADDMGLVTNHINGAGVAGNLYNFIPIEGRDETGANWLPSGNTDQVGTMVANSDSITLRYLAHPGGGGIYSMTPAMTPASFQIHTSAGSGIAQGDVIAISDCVGADIFVATTTAVTSTAGCVSVLPTDACRDTIEHRAGAIAGADPGNATGALSRAYNSQATILRYVTNRYYVRNDAAGRPVLFRQSGFAAPVPLIEGVDNLEIKYGEDTAGSDRVADVYSDADAVLNWNDVVSVRFALLMRSIEEYGADFDTRSYSLLGRVIDPTPGANDRRRRRVFTTTVEIRNRGS